MLNIIPEFLNIIQNLSPKEIIIIILATAFLLVFLVYRKLGLGATVALLLVYLIGYVIYANNLINYYQSQNEEKDSRMEAIEKELQK